MKPDEAVMEIAIRKVKKGQEQLFAEKRSAFISKLKQESAVEKDWEFSSFFTMPVPDDSDVFVGMTRYASPVAMQGVAERLMGSEEAQAFFATFDMKSFVAVQPADGSAFALEDKLEPGNVLEVAVRDIKPGKEAEFDAKRKAFFDQIAEQEGYLFDQEFVDVQTGAKVVLIGWDSQSSFQGAAASLQKQSTMGEFFGILDVKAYQALSLV